jgi:hypothetical protein
MPPTWRPCCTVGRASFSAGTGTRRPVAPWHRSWEVPGLERQLFRFNSVLDFGVERFLKLEAVGEVGGCT